MNQTILKDVDGNLYKTVIIGEQVWMAENLKVTKYNNGDAIPTGHSDSEWSNLSTGVYAVYNDDKSNTDTYGNLYNWYAINDPRGLAPEGWHVATDKEWETLVDLLGGLQNAGGKMKEIGTTHWDSPNEAATNQTGFTALAGGLRDNMGYIYLGEAGFFWSSTEDPIGNEFFPDNSCAWYWTLRHSFTDVFRVSNPQQNAFSVRCIKD
jgi:uncharacterized protein (TIGR02145 family)